MLIDRLNQLVPQRQLLRFLTPLALCVVALLLIQSLFVPYWQDDYIFLLAAQQASLLGESWFAAFLPDSAPTFWRPLGIDIYWRFIESGLNADVQLAHLMNLFLHLLSAAAVGWLAFTFVQALSPHENLLTASLLAAFLYAIHAANILPVIWVSAANSSLCVLFAALSLSFLIRGVTATRTKHELSFLAWMTLCYCLALFCREISIVIPALGFILLCLLRHQIKLSRNTVAGAALCAAISLLWLIARNNITGEVAKAYDLNIGSNVIRNSASLSLFFFNMPREAMRFLLTEPTLLIAAWALACVSLQAAAVGLFLMAAWERLNAERLTALCLFLIISCAPYFLLDKNSYAYYVAFALFAYAIVIALIPSNTRLLLIATMLATLSSTLSWAGNHFLDYPSLIGRAHWAELQLQNLESSCSTQQALCSQDIYLQIENEHKFLGFGNAGLAYRTEMDQLRPRSSATNRSLPKAATILVIPDEGNVYFR